MVNSHRVGVKKSQLIVTMKNMCISNNREISKKNVYPEYGR